MHLLAAALDVAGAHPVGDGLPLLGGDRCEALCLEEFNACALVAEIRFQANQDNGGCGAKVQNLGVPLGARLDKSLVESLNPELSLPCPSHSLRMQGSR